MRRAAGDRKKGKFTAVERYPRVVQFVTLPVRRHFHVDIRFWRVKFLPARDNEGGKGEKREIHRVQWYHNCALLSLLSYIFDKYS